MGMVIELPRPVKARERSRQLQNAKPIKEAKILFFSGVRYSRYYEPPAKVAGTKRD